MSLRYPAQLSAKLEVLRDALQRTGGFTSLPEIAFIASERELAYRARIRVHVGPGGALGFFAADSRELVEIPACLVADPELNVALSTLRAIASRYPSELAAFSELELRVAPAGPRLSLCLTPKGRRVESGTELMAALAQAFRVSVVERTLPAEADQRFPLPGGVELRVPGAAFTQVNWAINRALVEALLDGVAARASRSFCDLYCGAGNFSLPLYAQGLTGVGIEASSVAISGAKRAAKDQGFDAARFIAGDVRDGLARLPRAERFDVIVLDPPRSGAKEILPELIRRAPKHIAYCACDPVTLARDLRALCEAGFTLEQVTGFDMFPQTHHFETLAWLGRTL